MRRHANCLKRYRKVRGLSQKDVARILGVKNSSMISRWERGLTLPDAMNIFKMALIYRTMADALYIDLLTLLKDEIQTKEEALGKNNHYA